MFNSGYNASGHKVPTKKSLLSGSLYGLQLQFYIGYDDRLSTFNAIYGKGGFLKVENSSMLLDDTLDGIFLAPGKSSVLLYLLKWILGIMLFFEKKYLMVKVHMLLLSVNWNFTCLNPIAIVIWIKIYHFHLIPTCTISFTILDTIILNNFALAFVSFCLLLDKNAFLFYSLAWYEFSKMSLTFQHQ